MILDAESYALVNAIESLLRGRRPTARSSPSSWSRCSRSPRPRREHARGRAPAARAAPSGPRRAPARGLRIGSAGTHPFAIWEDQRIVARPRYRDLVAALRFVARQELIFGMHVHVGVDDPDKAIHVANGMRVHLAVLLALSANSPFWRGDATGLARRACRSSAPSRASASRRTTTTGTTTSARSPSWSSRGVMEDYTYSGTTSARTRTSAPSRSACATRRRAWSTRSALAALIQAMVKEFCRALRLGRAARHLPVARCSTRTSGWPPGTASRASSSTCPPASAWPTQALARRLVDRLREHAQDLGSAGELEAIDDLLGAATAPSASCVVYEANHDLRGSWLRSSRRRPRLN